MGIIWSVSTLKMHEKFIPEKGEKIKTVLFIFSRSNFSCFFLGGFLQLFMDDVFGVTSFRRPWCRYFKFLTDGT